MLTQGAVFELTDTSGKQLGWVLKTVTAGPAAAFNCLFPGIKREWIVGRQLCLTLGALFTCKVAVSARCGPVAVELALTGHGKQGVVPENPNIFRNLLIANAGAVH